ncbi:MAG: peptidylprolyl isomerase [Anaerolineae bacterium]|nr:peptidylprolyl isomerase [Anaerolineae bacterium]
MARGPKKTTKKHIARLERERRQIRLVNYIAIGVVAAIFLVVGYGILDIKYLQLQQPIAVVNGENISTKEFQARVVLQRNELLTQYFQYTQYQQQFGLDVTAQLEQIVTALNTPFIIGQQVLDIMIGEALTRQEAAQRGIRVSEDELETFTHEQFGFYPDGTPTPTITPTEVTITYPTLSATQLALVTATSVTTKEPTVTPAPTATLDPELESEGTSTPAPTPFPSPTATPYTLEGFQNLYEEVLTTVEEEGLTEQQFYRQFETSLLRRKLINSVTEINLAEEERILARHILVADENTALEIIDRINNGEDFSELAIELSEDAGSGAKGGDLGWFGRGVMVAPFETVAFTLEDGEISDPVESEFGWHIIQTLEHTTRFSDFIAELREAADIEIFDYWVERVPGSPNLQDFQQPNQQ